MANQWHVRPSAFLALDNTVEAYYFDKAILTFGTAFDADMEQASKSMGKKPDSPEMTKLKRQRRLDQWLNDGVDKPKGSGFRDPAAEM